MDDHIYFAITIHITKFKSDRRKVAVITGNVDGSHIANRFSRITSHELNDNSLPVIIGSNKVTGFLGTVIVMTYDSVCLVGTGCAIADIIIALQTPCQYPRTGNPHRKHCKHPDSERHKPVNAWALL